MTHYWTCGVTTDPRSCVTSWTKYDTPYINNNTVNNGLIHVAITVLIVCKIDPFTITGLTVQYIELTGIQRKNQHFSFAAL
jgi:hypothetical protein